MMSLAFIFAALLQAANPDIVVTAPVAPAPVRQRTLFIAPSGEPFRGYVGDPYPVVTWFAQADADHDGKLTRSEMRRDALNYFAVLDANHDGVIDAKEITRYEEELVPEVQVNFDGANLGFRDRVRPSSADQASQISEVGGDPEAASKTRKEPDLPRGGGRYSLINTPEPVVAADADLNRRISPAEMVAASDRRFALLDPDEKGYLTLATLPKTPIQARAEARVKKAR